MTRREILTAGVTALSLNSVGHGAFGFAAAAGQIRLPFDTIIMDGRLADHEFLSGLARSTGARCCSIRGDLTRVWFDSLRRACLEGSTVIAGFTSDLDSAVMRSCARDVGYRQVLRLDITMDVDAGRETIRQSIDSASPDGFALSSNLRRLLDFCMTSPAWPGDRPGPTQFAAWVIAPIRG